MEKEKENAKVGFWDKVRVAAADRARLRGIVGALRVTGFSGF